MTGHSPDPHGLGDLDPAQFTGDAPAGDSSPGEFVSSDVSPQSSRTPGAAPSADQQHDDPDDTQEDA